MCRPQARREVDVLERTAARERHAAEAYLAELEQMRSAFAEAVAERDALVRIQAALVLAHCEPRALLQPLRTALAHRTALARRHWPVGTGPALGSPRWQPMRFAISIERPGNPTALRRAQVTSYTHLLDEREAPALGDAYGDATDAPRLRPIVAVEDEARLRIAQLAAVRAEVLPSELRRRSVPGTHTCAGAHRSAHILAHARACTRARARACGRR
jgi:hypothetical protein